MAKANKPVLGISWDDEEKQILSDYYPAYGYVGVSQQLEKAGKPFRSKTAVDMYAIKKGVKRTGWSDEEIAMISSLREADYGPQAISKRLTQQGYDRSRIEVGKKLRELGLWNGERNVRHAEYDLANEVYIETVLYRDFTQDTVHLIRLWARQGDTAKGLAQIMKRPLWLVEAIITNQPWKERWESEQCEVVERCGRKWSVYDTGKPKSKKAYKASKNPKKERASA